MMRKQWVLAGAAVLVAASATGGVVAMSGAKQATAAAQEPLVNTETVERGRLSDMVSQYGNLTYRARSDGSPYTVAAVGSMITAQRYAPAPPVEREF